MPHQLCALAAQLFFFVAKLSCSDVKLMRWGEYGFYGQWPPSSRCSACYGTFSGWVGSGQDLNERSLVYVSLEKDSEPHKKYEKKHWKHDFLFSPPKQDLYREKQLQYTSQFMKFLFERGTVGTCVCFRFRSLWKDRCFFWTNPWIILFEELCWKVEGLWFLLDISNRKKQKKQTTCLSQKTSCVFCVIFGMI